MSGHQPVLQPAPTGCVPLGGVGPASEVRCAVFEFPSPQQAELTAIFPETDPNLTRALKDENLSDGEVTEVQGLLEWAWEDLNFRPHAYQATTTKYPLRTQGFGPFLATRTQGFRGPTDLRTAVSVAKP